jgi:seryl-tRNA synthetase
MIDIQWIRRHAQNLDQSMVKRGKEKIARVLLDGDAAFRCVETELQNLRTQLNQLTKDIALEQDKEKRAILVQQATNFKDKEKALKVDRDQLERQRNDLLLSLPNVLCSDVPEGKDESDNVQIACWGTPPTMCDAKNHMDIARALGGVHPEQAARVSGARFLYLSGVVARLERALSQWMLDVHTQEFGFTELSPPYLVTAGTMQSTGQLPKFKEDLFCTTEHRYLIPTGEVPLVAFGAGQCFQEDQLPLCLTALTPCFRAEAGASGKDTHGMIRQHQFHKVELVVLCREKDVDTWHEKITHQACFILEKLDLPYRKMLLCAGDTGHGAQKTYDLEVWMPSQGCYREISSSSRCGDYQGRRMSCKIKTVQGDMEYVHTLNASGVAVGRALAAILENGQSDDGCRVRLPKVLHRYMNAEYLHI